MKQDSKMKRGKRAGEELAGKGREGGKGEAEDGDEKQENGRGAEDFRGGSKNTENAPLFLGSARIYARVETHAGAYEETWSANGQRGGRERRRK